MNKIKKIWNYFTTYEKIWLISLCVAGITLSILFPNDKKWITIFEIITLVGGCTTELLMSKQCRWNFIISFFFYDLTEAVVYFANGYYVSGLFELIFWMPILVIGFISWNKHIDKDDNTLTEVKEINLKRDALIFFSVLSVSLLLGALFTLLDSSEYWYLDALANTFSVCNGLFIWLRYKEQWIAWYGASVIELVMWILSGSYVMLILSVGYFTNTTYGLIKWTSTQKSMIKLKK